MIRRSETGAISMSVIVAVTTTLLFFGTSIFAVISFMGMQDYKNNTNQKIEAAEEVAKKKAETAKDNQFAEDSKSPVKTYNGSATYGDVSFTFPRTYSAYVIEKDSDQSPIDGYFHPNIVPNISDNTVSFGLRVRVVGQSYDSILKTFDNSVKTGKVSVTAFRADKVPQTLGSRIEGQIFSQKQGSLILLPIRDKTLEIWTESSSNKADFDKYVVPSITFVP